MIEMQIKRSWLLLFAQKRPNIVLIMADDMEYSDIGFYGSEIPTPNLDMPARNGIRIIETQNDSPTDHWELPAPRIFE